jgi:hypothetical protein
VVHQIRVAALAEPEAELPRSGAAAEARGALESPPPGAVRVEQAACSPGEILAGTTDRSPLSTSRCLEGRRWGVARADTTSRSWPSTTPGRAGPTRRIGALQSREIGPPVAPAVVSVTVAAGVTEVGVATKGETVAEQAVGTEEVTSHWVPHASGADL